jgi:hypothetical protein
MKTLLYVFAFVWFLTGLATLISGQHIWMGISPGDAPAAGNAAIADTATLGWLWLWTFPMPALLAAALGALLGRLDEIRDAIEFATEPRDDGDESDDEPAERVDPYIGEGFLASARPGTKRRKSERDHTLS